MSEYALRLVNYNILEFDMSECRFSGGPKRPTMRPMIAYRRTRAVLLGRVLELQSLLGDPSL